jgi:hypothetical protein
MTTLAEAFQSNRLGIDTEQTLGLGSPEMSSAVYVAELVKTTKLFEPTAIAKLAKAYGPTITDPAFTKAGLGLPQISSAAYVAELVKTTKLFEPTAIAKLAKAVGSTMPDSPAMSLGFTAAAKVMGHIVTSPAFKDIVEATAEIKLATPADSLDQSAEQEGLASETDTPATQGHEITAAQVAMIWALAFLIVWVLWTVSELSDLERSGEMLQNMDRSELLKFFHDTVDVPSYFFGVPGTIHTYLVHAKRLRQRR